MSFLFKAGNLLDPRKGELVENVDILVEEGLIREVSDRPLSSSTAQVINLNGKVIMPGLIDCHIHVFLSEVNIANLEGVPLTMLTARSGVLMRNMLMRGFTSVRDTGGADYGIRDAVAQGLMLGPRLFVAGAPVSQTGGHGDFRRATQSRFECACCSGLSFTARVADGVPEVIKAVRDELRKGADHIKIMCSGGVASQSDPLESLQFRMDEIEAACEEADRWGRYVAAHAYSAQAVKRAVMGGVRTIEHGNLIDQEAAELMAARGAFLVPTLVAYDTMQRRAKEFGMSEYSLAKNLKVLGGGLRSIEISRDAGVEIGFGSDLLGQLQDDQCREFLIRSEVLSPAEIIRSATITNARIVRQEGMLGELIPGAHADLLVLDGNPLQDLNLFQDQGAHIPLIMKGGVPVKNKLDA
ncbi:metal-dependent hydrolase family protein [Paralcaligenes ureilyticus]|uniref:Imidazolonepropionase-like amidohydrolase n=1 Tax=Paralcaligenes ureilyticus TaxID=627131 RepID=A0A4R3M9L9_9BURK|nr:amidohydrolase family protein [Paralcaligenes ureilyticus]TCT10274.1 imidazolonepropionase-like amidohydrolase [Paralcaligenes ureilyticus]